ncbi:MAG: glycosidase [Spirochaetes bacterium]|nr:glycosidase [Spirochaetota bacterium]
MELTRISKKPILAPVPYHDWEKAATFNCGAVCDGNGLVHMIYRAVNTMDPGTIVSSLGYAVSEDGINFFRLDKPVFTGQGDQEKAGCEDPRITKIDEEYFMVYVAYSGKYGADFHDTKICMASTKNFIQWKRHGVILDERDNKDAALFPEKINGKYTLLHRRKPHIWITYSDNFHNWQGHTIIMKTIEGSWESQKIGIAGPPHRTEKGWLLFYHAMDEKNTYRLGVALLDLNDPSQVLIRQKEPVLEPELNWELKGLVPNVVFSCGSVKMGKTYFIYYGGADTVIGVASVTEKEVNDFLTARP